MKLAAIDIGSNSIKLIVVEAAAGDSFAVITREKEFARLGHQTLRRGRISRDAIDRAAQCLTRFKSIAEARGAESIIAIATASIREASNANSFVKEIEQKTGIKVDVLSGIEEARLIGLAANLSCSAKGVTNLNIDIGGGSTEISVFKDSVPIALFSVDLGAVGLTEEFLRSDPPKNRELTELRAKVQGAFERPARELKNVVWQQVTGTSGTILALGATLRERKDPKTKEQPAQPSETQFSLGSLSRLNAELARLPVAERKRLVGISAQRSEIIVAGGLILEGGMRALGLNSLKTCEWALREGAIIDRLRELEAEALPPLSNFDDPKLRSVHAVGRRFGYEEPHSLQVAKLAETIFDCLAPEQELTRHHRTLLSAAALLHDIGYHIAHRSHHKHSLYLIKNSELTGFSEGERAVIANIARYHRGSVPRVRHPDFAALNEADQDSVVRLGAILRIADALDRSHESRVRELKCELQDNQIQIDVIGTADCQKELTEAERKRPLFEEAFNCRLLLQAKSARNGLAAAKQHG